MTAKFIIINNSYSSNKWMQLITFTLRNNITRMLHSKTFKATLIAKFM